MKLFWIIICQSNSCLKLKKMKKIIMLFLLGGLINISCSKDDDTIRLGNGPIADPTAEVDAQDFMWKAMNFWYFWQADVDNLADDRFTNSQDYTAFLQSESDPAMFFDNQLRFGDDRFSFYGSDYVTFTNSLSGVTKSNGLSYGLINYDGNLIVGYVRLVVPNSDAASKNIFRGEFFTGVDGQTLTLDNYIDLLNGDNDTYTLNMADLANDSFTPNGKEVTLTKQEGFQENPIHITNTFEINGHTIGYLFYSRFLRDFNENLNDAISQLKSQGITDLVLDLRYNRGGSSDSARYLASMIFGTNTNDLFSKQRWNSKRQENFSAASLEDYFADRIGSGSLINSLNFNTVYVLTTESSASASELLINALDPYMQVIQVGETTRGKNEFSLTMVDDPLRDGAPYIYSPSRVNSINPDNSWAIQPICGRIENSVGFSDFTSGLIPEIELEEDLFNLGILGDINEPLLAKAIEDITGLSGKRDFTVEMPANPFTDSEMFSPLKDNLILDKMYYTDFSDQ
jgi:C-terminal processing protease CtpA/Prc